MQLCGRTKSMFFRLCTRAPRTLISSASPGTAGRGAELVGRFSVGFVAMCVNQKLYAAESSRANERSSACGTVCEALPPPLRAQDRMNRALDHPVFLNSSWFGWKGEYHID